MEATPVTIITGFLGAGKTVEARVRLQFRRHGTLGAEEKKREFFEPRLAVGGEHFRPPIVRGKIAARERELLKIIFE